jgi:tetratricopeptide (TPR) repeat protein
MWADPVVRILAAAIIVLIVGALMTLISMLVTGVLPLMFSPQTADEADMAQYQTAVEEIADPESWSKLILALARAGKSAEANRQFEAFRATEPDVTRTQAIAYTEAGLLIIEERFEEALVVLSGLRSALWEAYQTELATEKEQNWAVAYGIPRNWYQASIDMADIYIELGRDSEALEVLNDYLEKMPTDASTLVTRARLKQRMGDLNGAEKDFLAAQRFLPDDEQVLRGLEEVRAAQ